MKDVFVIKDSDFPNNLGIFASLERAKRFIEEEVTEIASWDDTTEGGSLGSGTDEYRVCILRVEVIQ
jgi:hypothetical protein